MFSYFLFAHFFIVIFNLLRNIVMEIVCWDARNLTLIVNIFWAILCFIFVLCPHFERMLYYDIWEVVLWKEFYGLDVIACDTSYLPWSMNRESPESLVKLSTIHLTFFVFTFHLPRACRHPWVHFLSSHSKPSRHEQSHLDWFRTTFGFQFN